MDLFIEDIFRWRVEVKVIVELLFVAQSFFRGRPSSGAPKTIYICLLLALIPTLSGTPVGP